MAIAMIASSVFFNCDHSIEASVFLKAAKAFISRIIPKTCMNNFLFLYKIKLSINSFK